jgi:hypothetical protein
MPDDDLKTEKQLIDVIPSVRQLVMRKLAQYALNDKGNDLYFFFEAISILRGVVGEDVLKDHYGEKYNEVNKFLAYSGVLLSELKLIYDSIEKLNKENIKEYSKRYDEEYKQIMRKVGLINLRLPEIFCVLLNSSKMRYMTIPSDAFIPQLKKGYRPMQREKTENMPEEKKEEQKEEAE